MPARVQVQGPVVTQAELAGGRSLVTVDAPNLARLSTPGQFAMLHTLGHWGPYLRRAVPFLRCSGDTVSFLLEDPETQALRPTLGHTLDLIGPLGHGFSLQTGKHRRLLLVAAGGPAAPLLALADHLLAADAGASVSLVSTAALARDLGPLIPPAVEVITAAGPIHEAARTLSWADLVAVSGPREGLHTLAAALTLRRPGFVQCYLPLALCCGLGWCGSCLTETQRGPRRGCVGGPVFDLAELIEAPGHGFYHKAH